MKTPTVIIPMAGEGSRLKGKYTDPKPFIKLGDTTLIELSLLGIPEEWDLVLVTKEEHLERLNTLVASSSIFKGRDCRVIAFPGSSSGQAETALFAMSSVPLDAPIIVSNCDTYFSKDFEVIDGYDGLLGTFKSSSTSYSYVEIKDGVAVRAAEKEVISDRASSGVYYFANAETYIDSYLSTTWDGERYIAPMYNSMISRGLKVGEIPQETVIPLGTPEEIKYALDHSKLNLNL
jgi:choline kinase